MDEYKKLSDFNAAITLTGSENIPFFRNNNNGWFPLQLIKSFITKQDIGLGEVDNTSDMDKPISTRTQQALDNKSNINHTHNQYALVDHTHIFPRTGLLNFTETSSFINSNGVLVKSVNLTADQTINNGSSTRVDLNIYLRENGSFSLSNYVNGVIETEIPRGNNTIDFSVNRTAKNRTTLGNYSYILGGYNNKIISNMSGILFARNSTIESIGAESDSYIYTGNNNYINANNSAIINGSNNKVNNSNTVIVNGFNVDTKIDGSIENNYFASAVDASEYSYMLKAEINSVSSTTTLAGPRGQTYPEVRNGVSDNVHFSIEEFTYTVMFLPKITTDDAGVLPQVWSGTFYRTYNNVNNQIKTHGVNIQKTLPGIGSITLSINDLGEFILATGGFAGHGSANVKVNYLTLPKGAYEEMASNFLLMENGEIIEMEDGTYAIQE